MCDVETLAEEKQQTKVEKKHKSYNKCSNINAILHSNIATERSGVCARDANKLVHNMLYLL